MMNVVLAAVLLGVQVSEPADDYLGKHGFTKIERWGDTVRYWDPTRRASIAIRTEKLSGKSGEEILVAYDNMSAGIPDRKGLSIPSKQRLGLGTRWSTTDDQILVRTYSKRKFIEIRLLASGFTGRINRYTDPFMTEALARLLLAEK